MVTFRSTPDELRQRASLFWPADLTAQEASVSVVPLLLNTQDKFISLLNIADAHPAAWKDALKATKELHANVFLKHLMILADVGGEPLKRLQPELGRLFPSGEMSFRWRGGEHSYRFKAILQAKSLDNKSLFVDGERLQAGHDLTGKMEDVVMLLLFSAACTDNLLPDILKEKCLVGNLLGRKEELETFVRQRYIMVSKITGGAASNALGQLAQDYIWDILRESLPDWKIARNGTIPGLSQNAGRTDINFDIVARSPRGRHVAIEISFQVTTNSVIERKAGQAQARAELLHRAGHHIAYVLDGAGNFERSVALSAICEHCDCTVAFSVDDLKILIAFLQTVG